MLCPYQTTFPAWFVVHLFSFNRMYINADIDAWLHASLTGKKKKSHHLKIKLKWLPLRIASRAGIQFPIQIFSLPWFSGISDQKVLQLQSSMGHLKFSCNSLCPWVGIFQWDWGGFSEAKGKVVTFLQKMLLGLIPIQKLCPGRISKWFHVAGFQYWSFHSLIWKIIWLLRVCCLVDARDFQSLLLQRPSPCTGSCLL